MLSVTALLTGFVQKFSFGVVGENVAFNIRKTLYRKLLQKHQGWYDHRENAPGILTTTLSSDCQVINGVSTEGLGSILEAGCSVGTGIVIAFFCSWRMALVCVIISPLLLLTGYMSAKRSSGLGKDQSSVQTQGDLLVSDSITNYRTVASFA